MIFESYSERGWSISDSGHDELAISRLKSEVEKAGAVFDRARVQWQRIRDSEDRQTWICYRYDDPNIPVPEEWRVCIKKLYKSSHFFLYQEGTS